MVKNVLALVIDYRTSDDAARLTCQVAAARQDGFRVAVAHVDNGNAVPVALSPLQGEHGVRLVRVDHNGGYAAGIRAAIEQATRDGTRYDAYWFLNSDLEVEPDCLQRLVEVLDAHPRVAAAGPTVYTDRSARRVWGARGVVSPLLGTTAMHAWPQGGVLPHWSYIPGCSLLVRAEAYEEVGGIPDRYGMFYEETHLCVQLQKHGWELWVESGAVAYHESNSMKGGIPAPYQAYYFTRNNLYFWKANFGIPAVVQLPRTLLVVAKDLVLPLRRARSSAELLHRLRFIGMGLLDSFAFLRQRYTFFERKHFDLVPKEAPRARS
jgi:GT2 family glycosyltransferase